MYRDIFRIEMINASLQKTINQTFLQLIEDLKGLGEVETFFKDFFGEKEYQNFVKKLAVIYWIRKNRPTEVIKNNLGVDNKYIDSVKKTMDKPGIKLAIKYMEAEEFANVWSEKIKKFNK